MKHDNWDQIKQIFNKAIKFSPEKRSAFLEKACEGNEELHREVEELIESYQSNFLEQLLVEPSMESPRQFTDGQSFSHYAIIKQIGIGGMGEVYLARDSQLARNVAIKILLPEIAKDEDRVRRFKLEALAASALNHPNIITLYEIGEVENKLFIVYEYIDGITLREKIVRNQLTISEAVKIVGQIADALAVAHASGIIHRDIKPENIMIRRDGYVKILDFGLVKQRIFNAANEAETLHQFKTQKGIILGSVQYMSPEQARGYEIDERTDIWSLGVVLYETLTGKNPFAGATINDSIAAILHLEPESIQKYNNIPTGLEKIIKKSLAKDTFDRYQSINDFLIDLSNLSFQTEGNSLDSKTLELGQIKSIEIKDTGENQNTTHQKENITNEQKQTNTLANSTSIIKNRRFYLASLILLILIPFGVFIYWWLYFSNNTTQPTPLIAKTMTINRITNIGKVSEAVISPDGKYVAYVLQESNTHSLWVRHVPTSRNVQVIPPAETNLGDLTFSADSNYIYYLKVNFKISQSEIYKIPVLGGTQKKVADKTDNFFAVSPEDKQVVFSRFSDNQDDSFIIVRNIESGEEKIIANRKGSGWLDYAAWAPDGKRIAFVSGAINARDENVDIVEIEIDTLQEKVIAKNAWFEISRLLWTPDGKGLLMIAKKNKESISQVWFLSYPEGQERRITNDLNGYSGLSVSADSNSLVTIQSVSNSGIWIAEKGDSKRAGQITSGSGNDGRMGIAWTPEGKIVYTSQLGGKNDLWIMNNDGSNQIQLTNDSGENLEPVVSLDGRYIVFVSNRSGSFQLWRMNIDGSNPIQLTNEIGGRLPQFSSDGKWIIYQSLELNKEEFPEQSFIFKISVDGGIPTQITDSFSSQPAVSPDGKYIAFFSKSEISFIPFEGGEIKKILDVPEKSFFKDDKFRAFNTRTPSFRWLSDSSGIVYVQISFNEGKQSLWKVLLNKKAPEKVSEFDGNPIYFDWSKDNQKLAYGKSGEMIRDVVIISNW